MKRPRWLPHSTGVPSEYRLSRLRALHTLTKHTLTKFAHALTLTDAPSLVHTGLAAARSAAQGAEPTTRSGRGARGLIRREVLRLFELILGHCGFELRCCAVLAGDDVEGTRRHRDRLRAYAKEAAHADHISFDLARLVEQDVAHVADALAIGAKDVGAFEFRRQQLIRLLRRNE